VTTAIEKAESDTLVKAKTHNFLVRLQEQAVRVMVFAGNFNRPVIYNWQNFGSPANGTRRLAVLELIKCGYLTRTRNTREFRLELPVIWDSIEVEEFDFPALWYEQRKNYTLWHDLYREPWVFLTGNKFLDRIGAVKLILSNPDQFRFAYRESSHGKAPMIEFDTLEECRARLHEDGSHYACMLFQSIAGAERVREMLFREEVEEVKQAKFCDSLFESGLLDAAELSNVRFYTENREEFPDNSLLRPALGSDILGWREAAARYAALVTNRITEMQKVQRGLSVIATIPDKEWEAFHSTFSEKCVEIVTARRGKTQEENP